ncbi:MAG: AbrB/MazE/SpoVT family DNA-binding domain-containing protein [Kiritimatiellia bacterium]|nr:AbrB/MazE/SpoVT family DNA-binding domain-containing protein [Kiritimatiellia bacterium]
MITKVQKWGNSLAVRIPRSVAEDTQLSSGKTVNLAVHDGQIVIAPTRQRRFKLNDLLRGVTTRNRHAEIATGNAVGREAW